MLAEETESSVEGRRRNSKGQFLEEGKNENVLCDYCGKEFDSYKHEKRKFCSHKCYHSSLKNKPFPNERWVKTGKDNGAWKGGVTTQKAGYVMRLNTKHPSCNMRGYVPEHRLVMEEKIGRYLDKEEVVHHVDKDVKNNNIENLMLFKNNSEHIRHHYANR